MNAGCAAHCTRCGAELFRSRSFHIDTVLALTLGSLVVFVMANAFPIVTLEMKGVHNGSTLFGAIVTLYREGMAIVSGLVLATTILFPLT
ncbi:MAG TPA: paraquat-inducible protein A, partial [Nitrospira sp.]|nr:paraquat-inducible protein A [Nitrospira sp.]